MDESDLLARARAQFESRLARVVPADLEKPTPCSDWDVRTLVEHVVRGDGMAAALLRGASREEALAVLRVDVGDDLRAAFAAHADELAVAFAEPGALERMVHHAVGEVPGSQLLSFRVGDYTYHAWDLARATGQDETLDAVVLARVWAWQQGRAEGMVASGRFGTGPSGDVAEDAPLQVRVLDMAGRRP